LVSSVPASTQAAALIRLRQPPITRPRRLRMPNWHRAATGDSAESG